MSPLRLSDSELSIVMRAAAPLDVAARDAFLQDVAAALAALPERGDGAVYQVCREIQRRHFDPPHESGPLPRQFERMRAS